MSLPTNVSEAVRRLNPGIFALDRDLRKVLKVPLASPSGPRGGPEIRPRLKQRRGPKLNKTEMAFLHTLELMFDGYEVEIRAQEMTLLLANGVRYTPDFMVVGRDRFPEWKAYEVKGPHAWDDAIVKLKVAAARWPMIEFWIASPADRRFKGDWKIERVLP